ncbi:SGNH/GDSL hydrolase family protein [Candidatus Entotheonella palauensis]|uniref:SGNH hydrolase-type esterase domain-containing protein n=1 Tax=Candidatus Entotheonella gemina TaxID=1429439 RepID=W4MEW6_9BACT|nr:GDSL-type esterase/lipase family protein [Candidatus Entotheonella palauensis]ETX08748.1 MAG: hypothetical protein ETSY2_03545 [Candidatus Entotheonella gemina]
MGWGRLAGTGLLCGLSLMVALLAGEWMVRYLAPQKMYRFPRGMFENHPTLQYRLAPGFVGVSNTVEFQTHIRTNRLGLRADREYGRKGPKTFRMLFLGDSFTMGVGVEQDETYGEVLARRLMEGGRTSLQTPSPTYEVINAGVPGYNTQQALTYLRESGLALEPDLVVLGFYLGNDIAENFAMPSVSVQDGYLQSGAPAQGMLPAPLRRYLALNSHLYQLLWPYQRWLVDRSRWVRKERQRLQRRLAIYVPEPDNDTGALWDATRRQVAAMAEITRSHGVPLAVVIIPEMVQVDPQLWHKMIQPMASNDTTYQADWPNRRLVALCHEHHLPVFDLLPVFAQAGTDEPWYLPLDGHWTRHGHAVAAVAIGTFLRQQQLLPVGGSLANR